MNQTLDEFLSEIKKLCEKAKTWQAHNGTLENLRRTTKVRQINMSSDCCLVAKQGDAIAEVISSGLSKEDAKTIMETRLALSKVLRILGEIVALADGAMDPHDRDRIVETAERIINEQ